MMPDELTQSSNPNFKSSGCFESLTRPISAVQQTAYISNSLIPSILHTQMLAIVPQSHLQVILGSDRQ